MSAIDRLRFAFQCPADWDAMVGTGPTRFCVHCRKNVHDLSAMTREEAETLIAGDATACVRMERRPDGTAVFRGCPKTDAARNLRSKLVAASLVGGTLTLGACSQPEERYPALLGVICPIEENEAAKPNGADKSDLPSQYPAPAVTFEKE